MADTVISTKHGASSLALMPLPLPSCRHLQLQLAIHSPMKDEHLERTGFKLHAGTGKEAGAT
jgi:hypothetical protein